MFKGFENLDTCMFFFRKNNAPTRGHSLKLIKPRCHLDVKKYSFAHRVMDFWNSLEESTIACDSINGFKGTRICALNAIDLAGRWSWAAV